jgi:Bacterial aa3 type cytochrome c oxidase subunit IV
MALVDPNFEQHRQTWMAFTRLVRWALAVIILILIGLAIFTL